MRVTLYLLFSIFLLSIVGCSVIPNKASHYPAVQSLKIDMHTLSFVYPKDGTIFTLHLGDSTGDYRDTGGITKVPKGIYGERGATNSYYEPHDASGSTYCGSAESMYDKDWLVDVPYTNIQYDKSSGRMLITENISDGSATQRYILYHNFPSFDPVCYIAPPLHHHQAMVSEAQPPDITLVPPDKFLIEGKLYKLNQISHSQHPFTVIGWYISKSEALANGMSHDEWKSLSK